MKLAKACACVPSHVLPGVPEARPWPSYCPYGPCLAGVLPRWHADCPAHTSTHLWWPHTLHRAQAETRPGPSRPPTPAAARATSARREGMRRQRGAAQHEHELLEAGEAWSAQPQARSSQQHSRTRQRRCELHRGAGAAGDSRAARALPRRTSSMRRSTTMPAGVVCRNATSWACKAGAA